MTAVRELVERYYTTVDAGDPVATAALFAADASYDRPGYPTMVGQAITDFYLGERVIESGAHELGEILVEGTHAASRGVFAGRLKDGSETRVGFADFFRFDEQGLISERTTYFYQAAV
ncbi:nuclear transport factor 2 family protein [Brevibacterium casei]|uniref:nuclear transport factor 2 family protein n=1 Tax=Brevibacterium casei TaxID=33889 RepID=UPI00223BC4CF|nr:nuclear transport factor 2 family protein [Brevibacterium casei]MBE8146787.1 nuclear transport factor 2 family protein [Brevibacterium casei]MCT1446487.1 nuclear transport factor 2 family protein [Brevibacterium casei]MCT1766001.1 nuclear transport factor 2 family protein [Brevibacterium casei]